MIILNQFHNKIKIFDFYFIVSIIVNINNNKVITTNKGIKNIKTLREIKKAKLFLSAINHMIQKVLFLQLMIIIKNMVMLNII